MLTILNGAIWFVVGTGPQTATDNLKNAIKLAGGTSPSWLTASLIGHWWWIPLALCLPILAWGFWPRRKPAPPAPIAQKTLEDYFKGDFDGLAAFLGHMIFIGGEERANLPARICFESKTNAKFVAVFVSLQDYWVWEVLPENFLTGMDKLEKGTGQMSMITPAGDEYMHSAETVFSGRVYIYHQSPLSHAQIAALENRFKAAGVASPTFRGFAYQQMENAKRR